MVSTNYICIKLFGCELEKGLNGDGPMPIDLWQPETAKNAIQPTSAALTINTIPTTKRDH